MPKLLADDEVERRTSRLRGWKREGSFITKTFEFKDFKEGMKFLNKVAKVAEAQEHHPDISVRYNVIKLSVQTHSEGGVTAWDFGLAREIDRISPEE